MTTQMEAYARLGSRKCPVCGAGLELVWQGQGRWRVSCLTNDIDADQCSFADVYGDTADHAVDEFLCRHPITAKG